MSAGDAARAGLHQYDVSDVASFYVSTTYAHPFAVTVEKIHNGGETSMTTAPNGTIIDAHQTCWRLCVGGEITSQIMVDDEIVTDNGKDVWRGTLTPARAFVALVRQAMTTVIER